MKLLVFLFYLACCTESYKILVVYPLHLRSINILGKGVVRHLLNAGHEVTFITTFPMDPPSTKKFRQIDISNNSAIFDLETLNIGYRLENGITENDINDIQVMASENARLTFQNENVIKFLANTNEHFDAVIADNCESEVYAGLAVLYNCPMIWLYSMGAHWQVLRLIADPGNPAYDADYLGYNTPPFTFTQRLEELWSRIRWNYIKTYFTMPVERSIYEQTFGPLLAKRGRELPDYEEIIYNASMIFGNEHNANTYRPSTPQNFKYIGGFHIHDPVIPLSKNLQGLMDNAPHGVIYFSMGSFWESKRIPMTLTRAILDVFAELKQTVIWKYEDELKDLPSNVHTVRWTPQQSILAHPNCKLFVTHGGMLSSIEAIHFGVPIIGMPIFLDQFINIQKAVAHKYAIKVDFDYDVPKNLKVALNQILTDNTFKKKAKELSEIYHDIPTKPGAELLHWVHHVVRTRGARHLRSPALNVPLYQRLYLDLAALVIGTLFILYIFFRIILKIVIRSTKSDMKKKTH